MSDFVKELNFDGDTFNDMKRDMNFVLQRLLGNMQEKKSTWSDEVTYKPLSEYVGERFELFLTEKRYDRDGRIASYSSDRKLSAAGLLTSRYLEEELGKKVEKLIANAKREVEESLIKSLEQNLKENLAKDTIERMNIPEVLKKLSSIGAKQVTGTSLPE